VSTRLRVDCGPRTYIDILGIEKRDQTPLTRSNQIHVKKFESHFLPPWTRGTQKNRVEREEAGTREAGWPFVAIGRVIVWVAVRRDCSPASSSKSRASRAPPPQGPAPQTQPHTTRSLPTTTGLRKGGCPVVSNLPLPPTMQQRCHHTSVSARSPSWPTMPRPRLHRAATALREKAQVPHNVVFYSPS